MPALGELLGQAQPDALHGPAGIGREAEKGAKNDGDAHGFSLNSDNSEHLAGDATRSASIRAEIAWLCASSGFLATVRWDKLESGIPRHMNALQKSSMALISPTDRKTTCPVCLARTLRHQRHQTGFDVSHCQKCGSDFAVLTPAQLPSYDEHYQEGSIYEGYHEGMKQAQSNQEMLYWYQPQMIETAGDGRDRVHLDIGSGLGTFPAITRKRNWKSMGMDVSPKAARIAKDALGIETLLCSIEDAPLAHESVSWISAFEVLEHVMEPRSYISRFRELLEPGGLVTFSVPNGRSRDEQTSTLPLNTPPTHINYFTRQSLNGLMEEHGFERIYDYEKPIAWGEIARPKFVRMLMLPWLAFDAVVLGHRGNRLLWVGREKS
jgi:SAM-dependent methyltransferase